MDLDWEVMTLMNIYEVLMLKHLMPGRHCLRGRTTVLQLFAMKCCFVTFLQFPLGEGVPLIRGRANKGGGLNFSSAKVKRVL